MVTKYGWEIGEEVGRRQGTFGLVRTIRNIGTLGNYMIPNIVNQKRPLAVWMSYN